MPKEYSNLGGLSPAEFAAVMAHALLEVSDYLGELGGYAQGEEPGGPEILVAAVAAEIRRRGLESAYRVAYLSGLEGASAPEQPEALFMGEVDVELTGMAFMRQRRTITLEVPTPRSAVEELAVESAGDHVWDYQGMDDSTIEVDVRA